MNHGGNRAGAGRPALQKTKVAVSVTLDAENVAYVDKQAGNSRSAKINEILTKQRN